MKQMSIQLDEECEEIIDKMVEEYKEKLITLSIAAAIRMKIKQ